MKILLAAVNAKYIHSNLAVYSLRAYAGKYAQQTEIAEYTINQLQEEIIKDIYKKQPDVLAFSCYIWNIEMTCHIITLVKSVFPETKIFRRRSPKSPIRPAGSFLTARISTMSSRAKGKSWCRIF